MGAAWPLRTVSRTDKEIKTILSNIEHAQGEVKEQLLEKLFILLKKRQETCSPVFIRR